MGMGEGLGSGPPELMRVDVIKTPLGVLLGRPLTFLKTFPHISCPPVSRKPDLAPSRQGQLLADTQMAAASQPIYLSREMLLPSQRTQKRAYKEEDCELLPALN